MKQKTIFIILGLITFCVIVYIIISKRSAQQTAQNVANYNNTPSNPTTKLGSILDSITPKIIAEVGKATQKKNTGNMIAANEKPTSKDPLGVESNSSTMIS